MKKILFVITLNLVSFLQVIAQGNINIHSITTNRQPLADGGYTLDGLQMVNARAKLLDVSNFGTSGTFGKTISIVDAYATTGSLESIGDSTNIDLFYYGIFDKINFSLETFSEAELDSFLNWSMHGGKLIIGAGSPNPGVFEPTILNSRWGFDMALVFPTSVVPTAAGASSTLFAGPFGNVSTANQGGSSQGYFTTYPSNSIVLADDAAGHPTMYLDCKTLDLVVADGDVYTSLGGISAGNTITSANDRLWANTIAFMDSLEAQPEITKTGNVLTTGTYPSYQWFHNGTLISGATTNSYTTTQFGTYSVNVPLKCGCVGVATQNVYPVGVDELNLASSIKISPNPITSQIISIDGVTQVMQAQIIDGKGSLIDQFTLTPSQSQYLISDLKSGIYFMNFLSLTGQNLGTQKVIKQ